MADDHPSDFAVDASRESTTAPPSTRYKRSNSRRNILIVAIVLVALVGSLFLWRYLGRYESTDDAQVDSHLYPVSARVSGYVTKVNVGDNQFVGKGTVLVYSHPKDYAVSIAAAKADLLNAKATPQSLIITVSIT